MKQDNAIISDTGRTGTMPEYATYLFDADGTLLNTVDLVTESYMHVFDVYKSLIPDGKTHTKDDVAALMGIPLQAQMEQYFGKLDQQAMDMVCEEYRSYQMTIYKDSLRLFPGVLETLAQLKAAGKKTGIVTSRKMDTAGLYAEVTGIDRYIDVYITPEATDRHKPEPEPVFEAMKRLNAEAGETVFVGDASFDIQSGNSAGVHTVFVGWSHNRVSELPVTPTYVISSMDELIAWGN